VKDCLLCRWDDADREFHRVEVWRDELWRLTVSLRAPVLGFAYLEPKRHIPYITDLDGAEARSLGPTLARVTRSLKDETGAELIYVNVHGDRVAHLHFNLAPHRAGDALIGGPGMISAGAEPLPENRLRAVADDIGRRLLRLH
jgi:diadenosine tetraphosphate (Ap4A) HIT family hydrolase